MTNPTIGIRVDGLFRRYVIDLASDFYDYPLVCAADGAVGHGQASGARHIIPKVHDYNRDSIPSPPTQRDFDKVAHPETDFSFDLFAAVKFWLCDEGNRQGMAQDAYDRHDRLRARASIQGKLGHGSVPIVNAYLRLFRRWLTAQMQVEFKPRRARIVLTHDVDDPIGPGDFGHSLWLMGATAAAKRPRATLGHVRGLPRQVLYRLRNPKHEHWNFRRIVELEAQYGLTSAFYFASTPWWLKGASPYDVAYDVRAPAFRKVFRQLQESGAEVGLHLSYNAHDNAMLLQEEKRRLERAAASTVFGGRHHYWHMDNPFWSTLRLHHQAGLQYDTSVGFNDGPGYRLGIGHPFYPWDPETEGIIPVMQIPTVLMDGALLYDDEETVDGALAKIDIILDDLKTSEATATVDWHVRSSYPGTPKYTRWAKVYAGLLERLASDGDIDVVSPVSLLKSAHLAQQEQRT